ncbi:MAG: trypsin-like serine protease [Asticcacaulis sp.]
MRKLFLLLALVMLPLAAQAGRVSTPPPASKVVGGQYADPAHWPGFAALGVRRPDGTVKLICGAAMIGPRHALTAAHCVEDYDAALAKTCGVKLQPVSQLLLFPGLVDMTKAPDNAPYKSVKVTAHPDAHCEAELDQTAKTPTYDNDLAVIEVDHAYTGPVSALSLSPDTDPASGLTAVAGMGTNRNAAERRLPGARRPESRGPVQPTARSLPAAGLDRRLQGQPQGQRRHRRRSPDLRRLDQAGRQSGHRRFVQRRFRRPAGRL